MEAPEPVKELNGTRPIGTAIAKSHPKKDAMEYDRMVDNITEITARQIELYANRVPESVVEENEGRARRYILLRDIMEQLKKRL